MILTDLRDLLRDHGPLTLGEIALRLNTDPDTIQPMLHHWIQRGRIRKVTTPCEDKGCTGCPPAAREVYEWTGARTR